MADDAIPPERTFASTAELMSDHARASDLLGQRILVGGRPALLRSVEISALGPGALGIDLDLQYLDVPVE